METVSNNSVHILFSCNVCVGMCSQDGGSKFSFVCLPTYCAVVQVFIWKRTCSSDVNVIRQPRAVTLSHTSFPSLLFYCYI